MRAVESQRTRRRADRRARRGCRASWRSWWIRNRTLVAVVGSGVTTAFALWCRGSRRVRSRSTPCARRRPGGCVLAVAFGWALLGPRAWSSLKAGSIDINVLMIVAVTGALALADYVEAASVVFLYTLGGWLESRALARTRSSIRDLMDLAPPARARGHRTARPTRRSDAVAVGQLVRVRPGERVPLDGVVAAGFSAVDEAAITGEPLPADKTVGDRVFAGSLNTSGLLDVTVTAAGERLHAGARGAARRAGAGRQGAGSADGRSLQPRLHAERGRARDRGRCGSAAAGLGRAAGVAHSRACAAGRRVSVRAGDLDTGVARERDLARGARRRAREGRRLSRARGARSRGRVRQDRHADARSAALVEVEPFHDAITPAELLALAASVEAALEPSARAHDRSSCREGRRANARAVSEFEELAGTRSAGDDRWRVRARGQPGVRRGDRRSSTRAQADRIARAQGDGQHRLVVLREAERARVARRGGSASRGGGAGRARRCIGRASSTLSC